MSDKAEKGCSFLDALAGDAAWDVLESSEALKAELQKHADLDETVTRLRASAKRNIASLRRELLSKARAERLQAEQARRPVQQPLPGLSRSTILERISELARLYPGRLAVQHRELDSIPDDDLRSLLEDLEAKE